MKGWLEGRVNIYIYIYIWRDFILQINISYHRLNTHLDGWTDGWMNNELNN